MQDQNITIQVSDELHQAKKISVYTLKLMLHRHELPPRELFYIGRTSTTPKKRAAKHKSALLNCRISTFIGMSAIFDPVIMADVHTIRLHFTVSHGGLTLEEAKNKEKELSTALRLLHGDAVLTRPHGAGS